LRQSAILKQRLRPDRKCSFEMLFWMDFNS
jgi:hypothetical protein